MVRTNRVTGRPHRRETLRHGLAVAVAATVLLGSCSSDDDTSSTDAAGTQASSSTGASTESSGASTESSGAGADTSAPATTTGENAGGSGEALVIARGMDVNSLDPSLSYCDTCQIFMTAVYETLIGLADDNTTLEPRLATKWESNAEQTEFMFTLDPNATFADGSKVTSADVKFSWERLKGLEGSSSYLVGSIETIDTPDEGTVVVTLSAANSAFLAQVNAPYLGIINMKVAEANGATMDPTTDKAEAWFLANSAGSGPFALAAYAEGNELRLSRNDAYWGDAAAFPEVIIKETPQAVTQRQQLEQGAVDIAMQISADVAEGMSGSDVVVERVPSFNYVYLALSPGAVGAEELTPEVREAIRLALDYEGLIDVTVGGAGQSQPSPIPNGFLGTAGLPAAAQDVDKAKQLLADAEVTELTLDATYPSFNVYGVDFSTAMQKVQTDLKEVGITLELNPVEIAVWAEKVSGDGIPVTMLYFAPDHTDPSQYVQYFGMLDGSAWQARAKAEVTPSEQPLLDEAFATQDLDARGALYNELALAMIADQIIIPLVNPDLFLATRADITGM
ncbi:MAG: ABC transporter substrate-binding protein, partial [Ilumatobacteraceae bacterium]